MDQIDYLKAIKDRDNKVIKKIYEEFLPKISRFVLQNKGNQQDAKDILDLAVYQISARLYREQIELRSSFEAFLYTACKNLWRRELNKKSKKRVTNEQVKELYYEEKDLAVSSIEQDRYFLFQEKLLELSENCKTILNLYFDKLSSKQIMNQLGYASETTVRQRIFKCKNKLIKLVQEDPKFQDLKNL